AGALVLVVAGGPLAGHRFDVTGELSIGREGAGITIDDAEVSRSHAVVRPADRSLEIIDTGSANGTFVNGERIAAPRCLRDGDLVRIGQTVLRVETSTQKRQSADAGTLISPNLTVVSPRVDGEQGIRDRDAT